MARTSDIVESMAIAGAVACLAHCIALPLAVALLPTLASVTPLPAHFHLLALGFTVPFTLWALGVGYRQHRRATPLVAGAAGLLLLAVGVLHFGETSAEVPVTIAGSIVIAAAHLSNWRGRRRTGFPTL